MMKTGWWGGAASLLTLCALTLTAASLATFVDTADAQTQEDRECRCVDAEGNEIENCTCLRMPRFDGWVGRLEAMSFGRPRLGITVDVGAVDAAGALVIGVLDDGPSDEAGLQEGDLVTALDGRSLMEPLPDEDEEEELDDDRSLPAQRLLAMARELEPGQEVEVRYERDGTSNTVTVEAEELGARALISPSWDVDAFGERMEDLSNRMRQFHWQPGVRGRVGAMRIDGDGPGADVYFDVFGARRFGVELVELSPELGAYFGADEGTLVVDVEEDSQLGLQPGDVILRIGDRDATTPARVNRILGSYGPDEPVTLHIRRNGSEMSVSGRTGG